MERIKDFVEYLNEQYKYNACYLWGGQGEFVCSMSPKVILNKETSKNNASRVMKRVASLIERGRLFPETRYFDCSGLGVYWFLEHELINSDTTANGLKKMCDEICINDIKKGDFVFKVDGNKQATHIGFVVDNKKTIIEMYGRDVGILKATLGNGSDFSCAGRPRFKWK